MLKITVVFVRPTTYLERTNPRMGITVNCSDSPSPSNAGIVVKTAVKSVTCGEHTNSEAMSR